jgi:hypothetical protein
MQVEAEPQTLTIDNLTNAWVEKTVHPNPEYQRGSTWSLRQKQLLVDSIFRGYPLPRFYFEQKASLDVFGKAVTSLQVIDGQQRLIAMAEFVSDMWATFEISDEKVALPPSIRSSEAPWAGRSYSQLSKELQAQFKAVSLAVVLLTADQADEVRDLFIRLQSGTPLTPQQVRDAWPGRIGPFIEKLAGKGRKIGEFDDVFGVVDRRGSGPVSEDEYEDSKLDARQTCAQMLLVFLAKENGRGFPSIRNRSLDDLYHSNTNFDPDGRSAEMFRQLLSDVQEVIRLRPTEDGAGSPKRKKKKITRNQLMSLFLFMRMLRFSSILTNRPRAIRAIAKLFWAEYPGEATEPRGGVTKAETLEQHFNWFVDSRMANLDLPELDRKRLFDESQKDSIWSHSNGICGVCQGSVLREEAEYDHITPWILGGRTDVSNGRPVHPACHARGLAAIDGRETPQAL